MKSIGKVREAHGLKGDLYIVIYSGDISWIKQIKQFSLKSKEQEDTIDLTVERVKPFKKGIIIKAAEIKDRTDAEKVEHFEFLINNDLLVSKPGETIYLSEIKNFKVKDIEQKVLGVITGFSSNGVQDLLVVDHQGRSIEIPFVEAFIKKIDFKHQTIVMDLPEGLLDLENA